MDAIILAGGLGTRLRPIVSELPKCMAPVCGRPFLSYLFAYLAKYPVIENVILALGCMKEKVIDWIDKQQTPFHISYSMETDPLGTGGAIKKALRMLQSDEALILNGDTLFNIEIDRFYAEYKSIPSEISISLKPLERFNRYGNISVNSDHIVTTFHEKCFCEKGFVNGGIYLLSTKNTWMDNMPNRFSFETDILQRYVGHGSISGFIHDAYFIDIGIPEDYDRANNEFGKIFPV